MEGQNDDEYGLSKFPRSWEDTSLPGCTVFASRRYHVVDVLVEKGMPIEDGTPLLILNILNEEEEEAADEDLDDSAPANKKQKVNDNGQTKQITLTGFCPCFVAEVFVKKGMLVRPSEPLYALSVSDEQFLSDEWHEDLLLANRKFLGSDELDETYPASTD